MINYLRLGQSQEFYEELALTYNEEKINKALKDIKDKPEEDNKNSNLKEDLAKLAKEIEAGVLWKKKKVHSEVPVPRQPHRWKNLGT